MIRIAVCDDDKNAVAEIEKLLFKLAEDGRLTVEIATYSDGIFLQKDIRKGMAFDLLYLDIEMEQMDGLSLAREFRRWSVMLGSV